MRRSDTAHLSTIGLSLVSTPVSVSPSWPLPLWGCCGSRAESPSSPPAGLLGQVADAVDEGEPVDTAEGGVVRPVDVLANTSSQQRCSCQLGGDVRIGVALDVEARPGLDVHISGVERIAAVRTTQFGMG